MTQSSRNLILLAAVVVVAGLAAATLRGRGSNGSSRRPANEAVGRAEAQRPTVAALGRLQPAGGIIDVGGTAGERVDQLLVSEGDFVGADQELARLGSYTLRQGERDLAEIQLAEARTRAKADLAYGAALVAEAEAAQKQLKLVDLDVDALRAKIDSLQVNLQIAERDQARLDGAKEIVSPQELDHQKLVVEQVKAQLHSARAELTKLEASRTTGTQEAQARLDTAKATQQRLASAIQVDSLEKALATATQKLELAVVRAPSSGRILRVITQAGETIGGRPILQLGDTEHMFATAEVYETDVRFVHPGQRAKVTSNALSGPLTGTVESVGMTVAKNEVMSLDPTATGDARVVVARIRLDDSSEASRLVDLQVDISIDTSAPVTTAHVDPKDPDG